MNPPAAKESPSPSPSPIKGEGDGGGRDRKVNAHIWYVAGKLGLTNAQVTDINRYINNCRVSQNTPAKDAKLLADLQKRRRPRKRYHRKLKFNEQITPAQETMINALAADLNLSLPHRQGVVRRACGRAWPQSKGEADQVIAALKSMLRRREQKASQ